MKNNAPKSRKIISPIHNKVKEKEEEAQRLAAQNERLLLEAEEAKQKAEEAALSLQKLQLLEKQMEELKRPLWKKWFLPRVE